MPRALVYRKHCTRIPTIITLGEMCAVASQVRAGPHAGPVIQTRMNLDKPPLHLHRAWLNCKQESRHRVLKQGDCICRSAVRALSGGCFTAERTETLAIVP